LHKDPDIEHAGTVGPPESVPLPRAVKVGAGKPEAYPRTVTVDLNGLGSDAIVEVR